MKKISFLLLLLAVLSLLSACVELRPESFSKDKALPPFRREVQVEGQIYVDMGYVNSAVKCGTADGEIQTSVSEEESPAQDDESNFGTGYEYQFMDKIHLNVDIDGRWIIFQNIAISNWQIPDTVANFKAEVIDLEDSFLLVKIVDLPDSFSYLFEDKEVDQLKPIRIGIEGLEIESYPKVKPEEVLGKTVQIYFDGQVEKAEAEMSYPMSLGEVYKIRVIE